MRCRFEKNGIAFAVPFFIVSEVQTIYEASAAEEGGGQHVAEENSQLRGIERIDCEGE